MFPSLDLDIGQLQRQVWRVPEEVGRWNHGIQVSGLDYGEGSRKGGFSEDELALLKGYSFGENLFLLNLHIKSLNPSISITLLLNSLILTEALQSYLFTRLNLAWDHLCVHLCLTCILRGLIVHYIKNLAIIKHIYFSHSMLYYTASHSFS